MRQSLLLPALAMPTGWGLGGCIGGGPPGARIPGAMTGVLTALELRQWAHAAWLAVRGALGAGLGGPMTDEQTVGLSLKTETFWW